MCWGDAEVMPHDVAPVARPQAMAAPASSADGSVLDAVFVAVAGSRRHVCGLTAGGLVACWRDRISEPSVWRPGGAGWHALEGGYDHICARSSTEVVCAIGAELSQQRLADPTLQVLSLPGPIHQTFVCTAPPGGPLRCEAPGEPPVTTTLVDAGRRPDGADGRQEDARCLHPERWTGKTRNWDPDEWSQGGIFGSLLLTANEVPPSPVVKR